MKILCVHQSADLYGSDRSFIQVIKYLRNNSNISELVVVLPRHGLLSTELDSLGIKIVYLKLSILSKSNLKKLRFKEIFEPLFKNFCLLHYFKSFDCIYINTSVILDFYFISFFLRNKKVIHVREIPPFWMAFPLSFLLLV